MKRKIYWILAGAAVLLAILISGWFIWKSLTRETNGHTEKQLTPTPGIPWFEDVTAKAKIKFRHFDSSTPNHYIQETLGSGLGWIDYDADGWLDLLCLQSGPVQPKSNSGSLPTNKLFRNRGDGTFTDVTEKVGLARSGFHMGCAVGDYDNDGFDDLVVTYLGDMVLYHNEPNGSGGRRFADVTKSAGLHNPHFGTSCAWGDIDNDGDLDLYVCNYVEIGKDPPTCSSGPEGNRVPLCCPPTSYPLAAHKLFRNDGNGKFADISTEAGIAGAEPAAGLGVVMCDLDQDGKLDIYVANDLFQAYLFHNLGDNRFEEKAVFSGCGLRADGTRVSGMGVVAGDLAGNGRPYLFVTNFQNQPNVLFRNDGNLRFRETSQISGLGLPSMSRLGFGTVLLDADLDGKLDIAVANGHVNRHCRVLDGGSFVQTDQLFLGDGKGKFRDVSKKAGAYFQSKLVSRGMAWADFDKDGKPDLAISSNAGPVVLLRNATETGNHWISLKLQGDGKNSNRNAIGSRIEIEVGGKKKLRYLNGGGSYLSANSLWMHVGLAKEQQAQKVYVTWPSGRRQTWRNLHSGKRWLLREGNDEATLIR